MCNTRSVALSLSILYNIHPDVNKRNTIFNKELQFHYIVFRNFEVLDYDNDLINIHSHYTWPLTPGSKNNWKTFIWLKILLKMVYHLVQTALSLLIWTIKYICYFQCFSIVFFIFLQNIDNSLMRFVGLNMMVK